MDIEKKEFSEEKRKQLADKGHALPDGSFPIENAKDLHNAIQSIGRAKNPAEAKAHIIRRAKALGAESALPEDWKVKKFFDDIKNLIKAIGTSSSVNEERDERSVENYVRGNANTNTNSSIGGNTMSNTTEPDPQGDLAINKTIDRATRPTDNVTVSDAPNNPAIVPDQATFDSSATSAIAPSKTDEVNTPDNVEISKAATCKECGQALPVAKADEITKAAACADCGKSMDLCDCMGKSVDEEAKETAPDDEKAEMKKSLWGGAFAPRK